MADLRLRTVLIMALRACGLGVVAAIILPLILLYSVLAIGHLAGGCGPGSAGGCEMGAGVLAIYALLPSFGIGAGFSVYRDLRARRR